MTQTQRLLKRWLKANNLTEQALAERLHITQGAVSHWMTGRGKPGFEVLGRLAALMEVPPSALRPEIATLFKTNGTAKSDVSHRQ